MFSFLGGGEENNGSGLVLKSVVIVVVVVIILSMLSKWSVKNSKSHSPATIKVAKTYVQKAAKMSVRAKQDKNDLVALIDVNYGLAFADAARNILPAKDINDIEGIDLEELIYLLEEEQSEIIKRLSVTCPAIRSDAEYAVASNWLA